MMAEKKARIEPEVGFPGKEESAGAACMGTKKRAPAADIQAPEAGIGVGDDLPEDDMLGPDAEPDPIALLEAEVAELRDKWTRALAETENVRRRSERDRRDAETYGGTRLARDMLTVWDNLERAMKAADDKLRADHGAFIEGVKLTQRELLNAFSKHKVAKVTPDKGEKFDPNRHQAMFEAPVPDAEPGTVIEVLQDGFVIADRLLRPAMVGVARAMPAPPPADDGSEADAGKGHGGGEEETGQPS